MLSISYIRYNINVLKLYIPTKYKELVIENKDIKN